jgi:FtsP/CotA-like multicopper oxidase with cupredoxin domain
MRDMNTQPNFGRLLVVAAAAFTSLVVATAQAAAPGISSSDTEPSFNLVASPGYISQPDGSSVYSWGYGCDNGFAPSFLPTAIGGANCPTMQLPGPTLIVRQGQTVHVTLHNNLPAAAGNTSILFPGFDVTTSGGSPGLLAREAATGGTVTYTFTALTPGTHSYYSGTQGDLQIEMGLYGALVVLPTSGDSVPTGYATAHANALAAVSPAGLPDTCFAIGSLLNHGHGEQDFRLAAAAYDHPSACYEREYLFQFSEMDPRIHQQVEQQVATNPTCVPAAGCLNVAIEPYRAAYFMINGRSFPDLTEPNYAAHYPHQPYNGNPHLHPGEQVLLRIIGQGRMQHPFHEHANHTRILARDGHMLLTATNKLAGPLLFTTTTTPGQAMDGIFQFTAKNLNWDVYGHADGITSADCVPDAYGYYTTGSGADPAAPNYYEWCTDHKKPLENKPFGQVGSGGPVTLPDPNLFANGPWYSGSPYLGPEATARAVGSTPIPPSGTVGNSPTDEAGFAYMWHSHNERELSTNNIFPGGMMMMMLVDPWVYTINEAN